VEDFEVIENQGVYVIVVNLVRSTINEANEFRKIIENEITSGHTDLIIDLSKCDYIDSTFFGAIIMALGMMKDVDKKLKVVIPVNPKEEIFVTTNTLKLFDLFETREEAINSFKKAIK
jgi:anti-anti-sigma factor